MKKTLLITVISALAFGFMIHTTLWQSAINIFQGKVSYTMSPLCDMTPDHEVKIISLADIRLQNEFPSPCISNIQLTTMGKITYVSVITIIPLLLSSLLYMILNKRRKK